MKSLVRSPGALVILCLQLVGCHDPASKSASSQKAVSSTGPVQITITAKSMASADPLDPQPQLQAMVHLDIYLLNMPQQSVSTSTEFWKRVDEEALGVGNRDILEKNGIRAGVAPRSEGAYFSQFFDQWPHQSRRSTVNGLHGETMKLELETQFEAEDLFIYTRDSQQPQGRTFSRGTNSLMLTFGRAPRAPSSVRMSICPTVHSEQHRVQFTTLNQERESNVQSTDSLFDLSLTADVPQDSFFIIAPGRDASRKTSAGGCFLTKASPTENREQVIVIVPTFLRLDGKSMVLQQPAIK